MFLKLRPCDLLILVQTKSQKRAIDIGEVAYPAVSREERRAVLYDRIPDRLRHSLDTYLDRGTSFDYVEFARVFDVRHCNLSAEEVLAKGFFQLNPKKNLGMGVLDTLETPMNSIGRLRDFLAAHAKCIAVAPHELKDMPWFDAVTTIPEYLYESSFANHGTVAPPHWTFTDITRPEGEVYSGKEILLPHVRPGLPFTTTYSDMCDTLCEPIRWAKYGGCWYNDDWHHWNSHWVPGNPYGFLYDQESG